MEGVWTLTKKLLTGRTKILFADYNVNKQWCYITITVTVTVNKYHSGIGIGICSVQSYTNVTTA